MTRSIKNIASITKRVGNQLHKHHSLSWWFFIHYRVQRQAMRFLRFLINIYLNLFFLIINYVLFIYFLGSKNRQKDSWWRPSWMFIKKKMGVGMRRFWRDCSRINVIFWIAVLDTFMYLHYLGLLYYELDCYIISRFYILINNN